MTQSKSSPELPLAGDPQDPASSMVSQAASAEQGAAATAPLEASDGIAGESSLRQVVTQPSIAEQADAWLRNESYPSGDDFVDHAIEIVRGAMAPAGQGVEDPYLTDIGDVESSIADSRLNPLRVELGETQKQELAGVMADYRLQIRDANRDATVAGLMDQVALVRSGDFEETPNAREWPEGLERELYMKARERFPGQGNLRICSAPGRNTTHRRYIAMGRQNAPLAFLADDLLQAKKAELRVFLTSYFLSLRGR